MHALEVQSGGSKIAILEPNSARLEALAAWFAAEGPALLRFAYLVSGDRLAAEDLVQEAFIRIWRAGGRAEQTGFPTYARRTVANLAHSRRRRLWTEGRALSRLDRGPDVPPPDHGERDEVWHAILRLSPQQRAIVVLRYYEHMTGPQIASVLGVSTGTVKKQLSRALARCKTLLGRQP